MIDCVFCYLGVPEDADADESAKGDAVFVVNGQSVCEKHLGIPHRWDRDSNGSSYGLGQMIARERVRTWRE